MRQLSDDQLRTYAKAAESGYRGGAARVIRQLAEEALKLRGLLRTVVRDTDGEWFYDTSSQYGVEAAREVEAWDEADQRENPSKPATSGEPQRCEACGGDGSDCMPDHPYIPSK